MPYTAFPTAPLVTEVAYFSQKTLSGEEDPKVKKPTAALRWCLIGFHLGRKLQLRCSWGAVAGVEGAHHSRLSLHVLKDQDSKDSRDDPPTTPQRPRQTIQRYAFFTVHFHLRWQEGTTCARDEEALAAIDTAPGNQESSRGMEEKIGVELKLTSQQC